LIAHKPYLKLVRSNVELQQRLLGEEVFGYVVEDVVAATGQEAFQFKLPNNWPEADKRNRDRTEPGATRPVEAARPLIQTSA
jgi:hypothetical protein